MKYGAVVWSLSTVLAVCHSGPAAAQEQEASHYEYKWGELYHSRNLHSPIYLRVR